VSVLGYERENRVITIRNQDWHLAWQERPWIPDPLPARRFLVPDVRARPAGREGRWRGALAGGAANPL